MSSPLSMRLPDGTLKRLGSRAQANQMPPRTLAQRYVEEGLRADEHPLICFVEGPAGRRARIVGTGLDVWEAVGVIRDNGGDVDAAADYLELEPSRLHAAVSYYGAFRDEVDEQISRNEQELDSARSSWLAGMDAVGG